jgi:hypothetical protein
MKAAWLAYEANMLSAVATGEVVWAAHAGDSRAVMNRDGKALRSASSSLFDCLWQAISKIIINSLQWPKDYALRLYYIAFGI